MADIVDEDIRHDDLEFNPQLEPQSAKAWLNLLRESEEAFEYYNYHCDNIDRALADMEMLADNPLRDRQMQIFWANMEVIKPAIYAQPPVPVVTTKFKDRRPVPTEAGELIERCAVVAFDLANIDELMLLVRDDLAIVSRGVAWCRYEGKGAYGPKSSERVCIDFKGRRDFLHSLSRNWREVTWVAAASYMTRAEARDRFRRYSGDEYQRAEYKVDKEAQDIGGGDARERAQIWEIWDKVNRRVVWVAQGCENILDEDEPHLNLRNFFPCPKPAYGVVQRGSLVPVPDAMQYRDQLEEINTLTARIHALAEAIEVKGFYPAGGDEIAEAVQTALAIKTPGRVLVPISNWAAFGNSNEVIIWLPIDQIATTIQGLVALRKQIIDDVYQITGLADIMRGDTDPNETLGAQQIKTQYGTTRIRDKQMELARIAKDIVEITVEIMCEMFKPETMVEMAQSQLPTNAMVEQQAQKIMRDIAIQQQQIKTVGASPQAQQMQQAQPDQAQQVGQQSQLQLQQSFQALEKLRHQPTIEQVLQFVSDYKTRAFVLDIETDSTILVDENQEKQRRTEFVQVLGQLLPQLAQMIGTDPSTAKFCGSVLKFATAPYRAGRELDASIDELVEQMQEKGDQGKGPDPTTAANETAIRVAQIKANQQQQSDQARLAFQGQQLRVQAQQKDRELGQDYQIKIAGVQQDRFESQADLQEQQLRMQENREAHQAQMAQNAQKMQIEQQKARAQMVNQVIGAQARAMRPPPPARGVP